MIWAALDNIKVGGIQFLFFVGRGILCSKYVSKNCLKTQF